MNLDFIKQQRAIEKDGAFMPIVFADLPAMICTGACYTGVKEVSNKIKNSIVPQPEDLNLLPAVCLNISQGHRQLNTLCESLDDIII
ncbi:MAG: hypothetical protein E7105_00220 [Prevotella sp.]|nr:hypothetical protein [Prevotella sp.]